MDNNYYNDLWMAWGQQLPDNIDKPLYRLYYNDLGEPLFYSMEDLPGNYIEVDAETFRSGPVNCRIVDGQMLLIKSTTVHKLRPGPAGTACHPQDVCIVVSESDPHTKWSLQ